MKKGGFLFLPTALAAMVVGFVSLFVSGLSAQCVKAERGVDYYLLVKESNAQTASVTASVVSGDNGAGYTLNAQGKTWVVLAAYQEKTQAETLAEINCCQVLCLPNQTVYFTTQTARKEYKTTLGKLKTLANCAELLLNLANNVENGTLTQQKAKTVLNDFSVALQGIGESEIADRCTQTAKQTVYAGEIRYIQMMTIEKIGAIEKEYSL